MMRTSFLAVALSALSVASAQMKNFTIDASAIPLSQKASWCQAELNTCPILCASEPELNVCEPVSLDYTCTCQNGTAPGLQYYTQTVYSFVCQQAFTDCNLQNVGNKTGQDACTKNIQNNCGTLDPNSYHGESSSTSTVASTSATGSATQAASASGTGAAAGTSSSKAAAPTAAYIGNGAAVVAAGIFAALL